jgi:hypothetical protein
MEIATPMPVTDKSKSKSKSGLGKSSGLKKMNKKEASEWFQGLSPVEQLLLKQEKNSSSNEDKNPKKEMHERERELLLKRRSEHEARMKAQLQSKAEITQQIQKCKDMRSRLIPHQMRLEQMQLHEFHYTFHKHYAESSSQFFYELGMLKAKVLYELGLIQHEEKVLFDMHEKHHCIKKSITEIIEKTKTTALSNPYTRIQAKNYVDNVYKMVTV